MIFLIAAMYSAFASFDPDFPLDPVNLLNTIPSPKIAAFFLSNADSNVGSKPADTSDDSILDDARHLLSEISEKPPMAFMISATVFSKKCDCIPVAPTLPISSLSVSRQQVVFSGSSASSMATRDVYAHTLSSWPYAMIILSSIPQFLAFPAGTISSSAERKSSSFILYFFSRSASTASFTASFSLPSSGLLANSMSSCSPSITESALFLSCS